MEAEGQFGKTAVSFDEDLVRAAIKASPEFEEKAKDRKPKHLTLNVDPELKKEVRDHIWIFHYIHSFHYIHNFHYIHIFNFILVYF